MTTVADLQKAIEVIPWNNNEQKITGDMIRNVFTIIAALQYETSYTSNAADMAALLATLPASLELDGTELLIVDQKFSARKTTLLSLTAFVAAVLQGGSDFDLGGGSSVGRSLFPTGSAFSSLLSDWLDTLPTTPQTPGARLWWNNAGVPTRS